MAKTRIAGPGSGQGSPTTNNLPGRSEPLPVPSLSTPSILPSNTGPRVSSRTDTYVPVDQPLPVIYGKTRTGAQVVFDKVVGAVRIVAYWICWGPVNSISNITIDGQSLTTMMSNGLANANIYTGTAAQAVDPLLSGYDTRHTSGWPGIAYVVAALNPPTADRAAPDVRRFLCDVEGMLVRDPRTDATLVNRYYRDNPTLCLADYLTSKRFGGGAADGTVYNAPLTAAANACDVDIDPGGGTTKRFRLALKIDQTKNFDGWVENIRQSAQMLPVLFNDGEYQINVDLAQAASGIALTDVGPSANILSAVMTGRGSKEVPSRVTLNFTNEAADYKEDKAEATYPDLARELVPLVLDLPGVPTFDQAQRLSTYFLNRGQLDKQATIRVNAEGLQILPGIVVTVTSAELNWAGQLMLVTDVKSDSSSPSAWLVVGELYSAGIYSDTIQTTTPYAPPASPSPFDGPFDVCFPRTSGEEVYWSAPQIRSATRYTGWSGTGLTGLDATKVNDGILTAVAFSIAATGDLILDAGSAKEFREVRVTGNPANGVGVYYSDNGVAWTSIVTASVNVFVRDSTPSEYAEHWPSVGSHRYWKVEFNTAVTIYEVHFAEWLGATALVSGFNIYDAYSTATPKFVTFIPYAQQPTSTNPLHLPALVHYNSAGQRIVQVHIRTVGPGGGESRGLTSSATITGGFLAVTPSTLAGAETLSNKTLDSPVLTGNPTGPTPAAGDSDTSLATTAFVTNGSLKKGTASVTVANGTNNDLAIGSIAGHIRLNGNTAAATITGLASGSAGDVRWLHNDSAHVITLPHDSGSSTAANRFYTRRGQSFFLQPGQIVCVVYSGTDSRWLVCETEDVIVNENGQTRIGGIGLVSMPPSGEAITGFSYDSPSGFFRAADSGNGSATVFIQEHGGGQDPSTYLLNVQDAGGNDLLIVYAGGQTSIGGLLYAQSLNVGGAVGFTLPVYANNAAAVTGGLSAGQLYRTNGNPDLVCIVH